MRTQGSARRRSARSSLSRISAFSAPSNSSRAFSHSSRVTVLGMSTSSLAMAPSDRPAFYHTTADTARARQRRLSCEQLIHRAAGLVDGGVGVGGGAGVGIGDRDAAETLAP